METLLEITRMGMARTMCYPIQVVFLKLAPGSRNQEIPCIQPLSGKLLFTREFRISAYPSRANVRVSQLAVCKCTDIEAMVDGVSPRSQISDLRSWQDPGRCWVIHDDDRRFCGHGFGSVSRSHPSRCDKKDRRVVASLISF